MAAQLESAWSRLAGVTAGMFSAGDVDGLSAAQARAEKPVEIVARGDLVSIVVEGPGFMVQQSGEAMEAGAQGEWIRVRPSGTRETLRARIEEPGRVVISRL